MSASNMYGFNVGSDPTGVGVSLIKTIISFSLYCIIN
jgi:hypothetical protein